MGENTKACFHLPGLFEFYELYSVFLPIYRDHREFFYEWCEIASIYGAPADCLWGGGRVGYGDADPVAVRDLMREYGISARLTFSNSLLRPEHLPDRRCNRLCELFSGGEGRRRDAGGEGRRRDAGGGTESPTMMTYVDMPVHGVLPAQCDTCAGVRMTELYSVPQRTGIILASDLLLEYLSERYLDFYFVSSTTKVLTEFARLRDELARPEFSYVVPDFRLNKCVQELDSLTPDAKAKVEFLCNECCSFTCRERRRCYENVSRKSLGEDCPDHRCTAPGASEGYLFSKAMTAPGFIGIDDILHTYLPMGFTNFKLEGRSLGSAVVFEILLYYLVRPEHRLRVRELVYLDSELDLF